MSNADESSWAHPVERLEVGGIPPEALNLNVAGRRVSGALQGFGPAYKKTYRVRLAGAQVTPAQLITSWKANYSTFWPDKATLYTPLAGLEPGDVAIINANESGVRLSTGVMVIYADDESFAFATAEGHVFSGWITFSAHLDDDGTTVAQIQPFIRTSDPVYEIGFRLFGSRKEDDFWGSTLERLAAHFGVLTTAECESECIDPRLQWSQIGNIGKNAMIRSALHGMSRPWRRRSRIR